MAKGPSTLKCPNPRPSSFNAMPSLANTLFIDNSQIFPIHNSNTFSKLFNVGNGGIRGASTYNLSVNNSY